MSGPAICVDLDGTLNTYVGWRGPDYWYPPRPGAREFLARLDAGGYRVVIFTTRDASGVWAWLRRYGIDQYVDDVTNQKIIAEAYVGDRAIPFCGDYVETFHEIETFRPFWQTDGNAPGSAE